MSEVCRREANQSSDASTATSGSVMVMPMPVIVRVGMRVPVVMIMIVVMMVTGGGHDGLEYFFGLLERNVVALEHLADSEVVFNEKIAIGELSGKVKIAYLPSTMSRFARIGISDLEHLLGQLLDLVALLIGEVKLVAMLQRGGQVKTKIGSVGCLTTPTALGQYATFDLETYRRGIRGSLLGGKFFDYLHN